MQNKSADEQNKTKKLFLCEVYIRLLCLQWYLGKSEFVEHYIDALAQLTVSYFMSYKQF